MLLPFLSRYYRSGLRGSYRLTQILSKITPLSEIPVPTPYGEINVDLRSASGQATLAYRETPEARTMKSLLKSGFVCYDIGAHWGIYSALMVPYGRTFAFEANSRLYPNLQKTGERLGFTAINLALSDEEGEARFFIPEESSMGSLADWTSGINGAGRVTESVCTMKRLDDIDLPPPDFIKIDVEGAELKVLRGARETLERSRPILYVEVMPGAFGYDPAELLNCLPGYRIFDGDREIFDLSIDYGNITFLPSEKSPL